jgi:hypothetical protein
LVIFTWFRASWVRLGGYTSGLCKERRRYYISTLLTVNNLGTLYVNQGKLCEAEKMYE